MWLGDHTHAVRRLLLRADLLNTVTDRGEGRIRAVLQAVELIERRESSVLRCRQVVWLGEDYDGDVVQEVQIFGEARERVAILGLDRVRPRVRIVVCASLCAAVDVCFGMVPFEGGRAENCGGDFRLRSRVGQEPRLVFSLIL